MTVELLRHGGAEIIRRWVAALLLVPQGERETVVSAIERRIVETYTTPAPDPGPPRPEPSAPPAPQRAPAHRQGVELKSRRRPKRK